ncbi:MAG: ABC-F family ATP-binding cassette domain-containing protein [Lachnospiraceae bacterium]|jgi:ATP-binding cassette subfamily F protein 3|nr:ABC-F family ATP-binding cassette domain-containing protein [Lachnospiraceae bacterium]MCH4030665.1 ABC-F family ATP-binding cassette domain-containing protein [Lachnospiraceae bacterium]MCH4069874.1 ABC-F family ATP-binding cassette domain-containing protein [Lachnospiraceae bacterium]MCH4107187.1 ABC-F family ATP-binding cassette domain-containing protein [Lachnospiraceae bacterium]MCI1301958.1 ABC-F family ATP-binding cassette domain-containing protein [Lachnospiraceae bacterium]
MLLSVSGIEKTFAGKTVLKDASFTLDSREKAAIVGINGAGKSTFLNIITGELDADAGTVALAQGAVIGYLHQNQNLHGSQSIYEELLHVRQDLLDEESAIVAMEKNMAGVPAESLNAYLEKYHALSDDFQRKNGYAYKGEVTGILKGLGFSEDDFHLPVGTLSGGQKTRVALGKLLLMKPDLLLLDEPTNHLDIHSIQWLEGYLISYPGAVLLVAHDRYFMDRTVNKIIEIENGHCTVFSGNYTDYSRKKEIIRNMQLKEYLNQQREIEHQEAVIRKLKQFNREKSIRRAESREKMLEKITPVERPEELNDSMQIRLSPRVQSGNDVLSVEGLSKAFGTDAPLFTDLTFEIHRGERVALIGDNGTGKTTILKILNGLIPADCGTVRVGAKVTIGYYDQEHHVLDPDKSLFDELHDAYPDLDNTTIRSTLAAFLFTGDDVFKLIRDLSGGERGRVSLAKLMLSNANFLILDEPTNHLDITSKEILESAINRYTGTVLYVSHDRYFINKTATRIMELTDGTLLNYIGNYDYYLEKKEAVTAAHNAYAAPEALKSVVKTEDKAEQFRRDKEAKKEEKRKKAALKDCEDTISRLEEKLSGIEEEMADPGNATNAGKLGELQKQKDETDAQLETLYEQWEQLSQEVS